MKLIHKIPPGRITRKARAYHSEIRRLRDAGYTLNSIRQALGDAGVEVNVSTVRREVLHAGGQVVLTQGIADSSTGKGQAAMPAILGSAKDSTSWMKNSFVNDARTGKQIVEEFMKGRATNPLTGTSR